MRDGIKVWKSGFEIELVAPPGLSRADLADETARRIGGAMRPVFYPQAEPSVVPGVPVFETLTRGFAVEDGAGRPVARYVDDFTLRADLKGDVPAAPGWYRVASDDARLSRLIALHSDPQAPLETVLEPARALFGGTVSVQLGGMRRLDDANGVPVAMAAPQPGERQRACEIITAPIELDRRGRLEELLAPARALGFMLPVEGAVHVHFDGARLCDARVLQRLLRIFETHRATLRKLCDTNPNCRRLGPDTPAVLDAVFAEDFAALDWPAARRRLLDGGPIKFCDFNISNLVKFAPGKHTLEIRILGPSLDADEIAHRADAFEAILEHACGSAPVGQLSPERLFGRQPVAG
jgi:hypothetical protein